MRHSTRLTRFNNETGTGFSVQFTMGAMSGGDSPRPRRRMDFFGFPRHELTGLRLSCVGIDYCR